MKFIKIVFIWLLFTVQIAKSQDFQIIGNKYTFEAIDKKFEGKIFVRFVVAPNGKIYQDSVTAIINYYGLGVIAEKAIREAPSNKYTQGMPKSKQNQKFIIPIQFTLDQLDNKDWSEYYRIKGNKSWDIKDIEQAKKYLTESLKLNKRNAESYYTLSLIYKEIGDEAKATENLNMAIKYGYNK
jgi:tetratricopeptide (TPR) repeat protein